MAKNDGIVLLALFGAFMFLRSPKTEPKSIYYPAPVDPLYNITIEGYTSPVPGIEPVDYVERTRFNGNGSKNGGRKVVVSRVAFDPTLEVAKTLKLVKGEQAEFKTWRASMGRVPPDYTVEEYREGLR